MHYCLPRNYRQNEIELRRLLRERNDVVERSAALTDVQRFIEFFTILQTLLRQADQNT